MQLVSRLTILASLFTGLLSARFVVFEPLGRHVVARTPSGTALLDPAATLLASTGAKPIRMRLAGARRTPPELLHRQPGVSHYLTASDSRTNVPQYGRARYRGVLPGIDLEYYEASGNLEYDLIVAPQARPEAIRLRFDGATDLRIDAAGNLVIDGLRHFRPRVYQTVGDRRVDVPAAWRIRNGKDVGFTVGQYDRTRTLVIDPVIQFATWVGSGGQDSGVGIALDPSGNVYLAGETNSLGLANSTAFQPARAGDTDAFVAKLAPSGALLWITYFGGARIDTPLAIAVDQAGNPSITGVTFSPNLPIRNGAQDEAAGGEFDGFAAKFSASGSQLIWSTYLGGRGSDWASGIASDPQGGTWITGWTTSPNFPVNGAWQGGPAGGGGDSFITRISPSGAITYSTYFGAEGRDLASGIAVDAAGIVYVTGSTTSSLLSTVRPAQARPAGDSDAFLIKLDPARNQLLLCTYLGGAAEEVGVRVAASDSGDAFVLGYTRSSNFPVTRGAAQTLIGGGYDLFIARLDGLTGALSYATYLGGGGDDWPGAITADSAGSAYIAGWTNSANFPLRNPAQSTYSGGTGTQRFDAVSARLTPAGDALLYSTYFGGRGEDRAFGIALDRAQQIWIAGTTTSADLPSATGEFSPGGAGITDAFVARLSADAAVSFLSAQPSAILLAARAGDSTPLPFTIALRSTGGATNFSAASDAPWVRVSPAVGNAPTALNLTVDPAGLAFGENRSVVTVRTITQTLLVPVVVTVSQAPAITATIPSTLSAGASGTVLTVTGTGFTPASRVEIDGTPAVVSLVDPGTLRVNVPPSLLRPGATLRLVVVNPDARSVEFPVRVSADPPALTSAGIVSAATWLAGPVSPGQIVILGGTGFGPDSLTQANGPLAPSLSETRVLFDGQPAPMLWAGSGRASAIVPRAVAGRPTTSVSVEFRGRASEPLTVPVQPAVPGLFTATSSGVGNAAALNQDGSFNGPRNPAERGSVIVLYATGLGLMTPPVPDGGLVAGTEGRPELPVTVLIGGQPAVLEYAGGVPGLVAGLWQLNVRVPISIPAGEVNVALQSEGVSSPSEGVFVTIR